MRQRREQLLKKIKINLWKREKEKINKEKQNVSFHIRESSSSGFILKYETCRKFIT